MAVQTTPATRPVLTLRPRSAVIGGVGAVLLLIAPLGLGWLFSPAVAVAHIPAQTLSFAGLHHLTSSGIAPTNWIQKNYFAWLGWVLIIATIIATGASVLTGRRSLGVLAVVLSVLGLVLSLFAFKGVLTWSQFIHQIPNVRVGAYLLIAGYLLTLASGLTAERR
jgi:hypothetical protein